METDLSALGGLISASWEETATLHTDRTALSRSRQRFSGARRGSRRTAPFRVCLRAAISAILGNRCPSPVTDAGIRWRAISRRWSRASINARAGLHDPHRRRSGTTWKVRAIARCDGQGARPLSDGPLPEKRRGCPGVGGASGSAAVIDGPAVIATVAAGHDREDRCASGGIRLTRVTACVARAGVALSCGCGAARFSSADRKDVRKPPCRSVECSYSGRGNAV